MRNREEDSFVSVNYHPPISAPLRYIIQVII